MGSTDNKVKSLGASASTKIQVNFNVPVLGYDGKPQENGEMLNKMVGPIIGGNTQGDAWKFGSWAMEVYQGKVLELDNPDFKSLKDYITGASVNAIIKMQILQVLDGVR